MNLHCGAVWQLLSKVHYLNWAKIDAANRSLDALLQDAKELEHILLQYPHLRYEPLDSHYQMLFVLRALDERLVSDICNHYETHYGWRASVILCVLVLLKPSSSYLEHMQSLQNIISKNNKWLVDLTVSELKGEVFSSAPELQEKFRGAKSYFSVANLDGVEIAAHPNNQYWERFELEKKSLLVEYRLNGLLGARKVIDNSLSLKNELRYLQP